jgi:glycine/D-amino acid oxidase-like deaminating enzyme
MQLNEYDKQSNHGQGDLINLCGALMIGDTDSVVVRGTLRSILEHSLPHEILNAQQVRERFPVFELKDTDIAIFEKDAGYINPEVCIDAYLRMANDFGAKLLFEEEMVSWESSFVVANELENKNNVEKKNNIIDDDDDDDEIFTIITNKGKKIQFKN